MPTNRDRKGLFIAIEGVDGTGKATQADKLERLIHDEGYEVRVADFPRYGESSAGPVEMYLTGDMGTADEVGPYRASVLFAVDRYCFASQISEWLYNGCVVISNRYVASNLAHQGGKISDRTNREKFWEWVFNLEYGIFKIPRPDINFILYADTDIAYRLVARNGGRDYLKGKPRDIHERDIGHLERSSEAYMSLAQRFPDEFDIINCSPDGRMLTVKEVTELLWARVKPLLRSVRSEQNQV